MLSKLLSLRGRQNERQPPVNEPGASSMTTSFFDSSKSATLKDTTITSHAAANGGLLLNLHVSQHSHSERPSLPSQEQPRSEPIETPGIGLSSPLPHQETVGYSLSKAPIKQKTRAQLYFDCLLPEGRGSPLYTPSPDLCLPKAYRQSGVRPGDVVTINAIGATSYLFNIFTSAEDPINIGRVPASFRPLPQSIARTEVYPQCASVVTSSSVQTSASGTGYETSREGALVAMPLGATSISLVRPKALERYLEEQLESWYHHALSDGRDVKNGDIRLVTGCDKTSMWGMATFLSEERIGGRVSFSTDDACGKGSVRYKCSGSAAAQTGPRSADIQGLRDPGSDEPVENQCIFLRTMNPSLPDPVFEEISLRVGAEGYNDWDFSPEPKEGSSSSRSSTTNSARVRFDSTPNASIDHPSSGVNKLLLQKYPKAKVVITEDIHWMSVVSKCDFGAQNEPFPSSEELLSRMQSTFNIVEDDGIITFEPRAASPPSTTFPPPFLTDPCKRQSATSVEPQHAIELLQHQLNLLRKPYHLDFSKDLEQHFLGIQLELMSRRSWIGSRSNNARHEAPSDESNDSILDTPLQHRMALNLPCRSQPIICHLSMLRQIAYNRNPLLNYASDVCWSLYMGRDFSSIPTSPEDDACEGQCIEPLLWSKSPACGLPYDSWKEYDRRQQSEDKRLCDIFGDRPGLSETIAPDDGRGRPPFKHSKSLSDDARDSHTIARSLPLHAYYISASSEDVSTSTTDHRGTNIPYKSIPRARTTIVCAECRRLKLKCDRRTPCGSCSKRDAASRCQYPTAGAENVDGRNLHNRSKGIDLSTSARINTISTISTYWMKCLPTMGDTTSSGWPYIDLPGTPTIYQSDNRLYALPPESSSFREPLRPSDSLPFPHPPRNLSTPCWQAPEIFLPTQSPIPPPQDVWASPFLVPLLSSKLYPPKRVGDSVESEADKSLLRLCQDVTKIQETLELSDSEVREDRLLCPTDFDLAGTEALCWTSQDPRDSFLFNFAATHYQFETSTNPSTGASMTVLSRSIGPQMFQIAKLEWGGGGGGLGHIILAKNKFNLNDFLRQDPDRASRTFTGSDGVCYRWRGSESNINLHLVDPLGSVISIYRPIKPTRYQKGTVYGELHIFPDPVTKNPVDQPMKDMIVSTAMLSRFRDAFEV